MSTFIETLIEILSLFRKSVLWIKERPRRQHKTLLNEFWTGSGKKWEIKLYWQILMQDSPKMSLCMCVRVCMCVWISLRKGKGWKNQSFAEFTSSKWLVARVASATFSHFWASHNVLHYKVQDKKEVVNADSNAPIHAKTDIPQKMSPSNKILHTIPPALPSEREESCAGLQWRATLPCGREAFQTGNDPPPRATCPWPQASFLPGPQRMSNKHWRCICSTLTPGWVI